MSTARQKERRRAARLLRLYEITIAQYEKMLKRQDGRCKICYQPPKPERRLAVDHDHATHRVRGLLCFVCNKYRVAKNDALSAQLVAAYLLSTFDGRLI